MRAKCSLIVCAALTTVVWAAASPATAGPLTASVPVAISGPSPFAACTVGGFLDGVNTVNGEVEPWVAVNPTNTADIIAVFQQDRWSNGGSHGLLAAVSHNGGATWSRTFPHFSTCAGGTPANGGNYDRSSDPWVTFGPDGTAYFASLSVSADLVISALLVSRSTDGGDTWRQPVTVGRDTSGSNFNDKESITADPTRPGTVYLVWDRTRKPGQTEGQGDFHAFSFRFDIMFSMSTDHGRTWSAPRDILARNRNESTFGNQVAVLPDGTLVDVFELSKGSGVQPSENAFHFAAIRSTDGGQTWSRPILIATDQSVPVVDPTTGAPIRVGRGLPDVGVDPRSGALSVVWADGRFSGGAHDDIVVSHSTDGGVTWSAPVRVNASPAGTAAFTPSVEVAADGTIGVSYYDFRNDTSDPSALQTDYFLTRSQDGGVSWGSETRITRGSFDMLTAPITSRGLFVGDYQGLATVGNRFLAVFGATTGNASNPDDIFVSWVG